MGRLIKLSTINGLLAVGGACLSLVVNGKFTAENAIQLTLLLAGLFLGAALFTAALVWWSDSRPKGADGKPADLPENTRAAMAVGGTLFFVALAYVFGSLLQTTPHATFTLSLRAVGFGLLATLPMLLILLGLEVLPFEAVKTFRDKQIRFFADMGFAFTPLRILLLSLGAGIGEELLFRGVFQAWLETKVPLVLAILLPAIVFGLLHSANRAYNGDRR